MYEYMLIRILFSLIYVWQIKFNLLHCSAECNWRRVAIWIWATFIKRFWNKILNNYIYTIPTFHISHNASTTYMPIFEYNMEYEGLTDNMVAMGVWMNECSGWPLPWWVWLWLGWCRNENKSNMGKGYNIQNLSINLQSKLKMYIHK